MTAPSSATRTNPLDSVLARTLAQKLIDGQLMLFAGAGLSHLAPAKDGSGRRISLWAGLTDTVARRFGFDSADFSGSPLDLFDAVIHEHSRGELEQAVTGVLDDRDFELSAAHRALAELPWCKVVTTNYDALLARLLDEIYPIVDEAGYDRLRESRVIQIHGKLPQPHTLTRNDYRLWPDKNPRAAQALCDFVLSHTLLFVGYSLSDPHIDELLALVQSWTKDREKRLYGLFWQMPEPKRRLLDSRDKITAVSIDTPEEWENAFRQIKAEYDRLSAAGGAAPVDIRADPFADDRAQYLQAVQAKVDPQPGISKENLNWQMGIVDKTSGSVTRPETPFSDSACISNLEPQFNIAASSLPPEFASQVTAHVFEQIRQAGFILTPREIATDSSDEDPALHARIDVFRDLFKDHKQLIPAEQGLLSLLRSEALEAKPWARFRFETNLGAIAFELGKESEGIARFEAAYAIRPDNSLAISNLSLVRTLQGCFDEAMELARRALEAEPRTDHAVCYLLQAAACSSWQGTPETLIPADLIGSEPADIGLAEFLRRRNAPGWAERTLELSRRHPETEVFERLKAFAILSLGVNGEGMVIYPGIVSMADLNTAADNLKALAERYLDIGFANLSELSAHLNNAAASLRLTDRHAECVALLCRGLEKVPLDPVLIRLLASAYAIQGQRKEAIATLESAPDPENQLLQAELISLDKPAVALEALVEIDPAPLKPRLARHRLELIGETALKLGEMEALESAIAALREQFPAEISADLLEFRRELQAGIGQEAVHEWLLSIAAELPSDADMATRYFLAEEMRNQGLPEDASRLLEDFVDLSRVHPLTTLYLQCLAEARRDQSFRNALASAAPAVREAPAILWTIAVHAWNSDDLDTAFSAAERLVARSPEVAQGRLLKIEILLRQNRLTEVHAELDKPVEALDWRRTEEACRIASLLAHCGYIERAVGFAYRLFLGHRDELID